MKTCPAMTMVNSMMIDGTNDDDDDPAATVVVPRESLGKSKIVPNDFKMKNSSISVSVVHCCGSSASNSSSLSKNNGAIKLKTTPTANVPDDDVDDLEDLDEVYFASGPFYAHLDDDEEEDIMVDDFKSSSQYSPHLHPHPHQSRLLTVNSRIINNNKPSQSSHPKDASQVEDSQNLSSHHNARCGAVLYAEMAASSQSSNMVQLATTATDDHLRGKPITMETSGSSTCLTSTDSTNSALSMAKAITATFKTTPTNNTNKNHCICSSKLKNLLLFGATGAGSHRCSPVTLNQKSFPESSSTKKLLTKKFSTKIMVNSSSSSIKPEISAISSGSSELLFPLVSKSSIERKRSPFSNGGSSGSASSLSSSSRLSISSTSENNNSPAHSRLSSDGVGRDLGDGNSCSKVQFLKCDNYLKKISPSKMKKNESGRNVVYYCATTSVIGGQKLSEVTRRRRNRDLDEHNSIRVIKPTAIRPATSISFYPETTSSEEEFLRECQRRRSLSSKVSRDYDNDNTLSLISNGHYGRCDSRDPDDDQDIDLMDQSISSAFHQPTTSGSVHHYSHHQRPKARRSSLHVRSSSLSDYFSYDNGSSSGNGSREENPASSSSSSSVKYSSLIPNHHHCSVTEPNSAVTTPLRRRLPERFTTKTAVVDCQIPVNSSSKTLSKTTKSNEPIHMTLEEVRRIAFGENHQSEPPIVPNYLSSTPSTVSNLHHHNHCDKSHVVFSHPLPPTAAAPAPAASGTPTNSQGTSSGTTKSKIKLAIENILNKTHLAGHGSVQGGSSSSHSHSAGTNSHKGTIYKLNNNFSKLEQHSSGTPSGGHNHHHHNLMSFIPNGYRRINIEDEQCFKLNVKSNLKSKTNKAQSGVELPDSINNPSSPFIRRALPPLPPPAPLTAPLPAVNQNSMESSVNRPQSSLTVGGGGRQSTSPILSLPLPPPPPPLPPQPQLPQPPSPSNNNLHHPRLPTNYLTSANGDRESATADSNAQHQNQPTKIITEEDRRKFLDYAASIERVKDCGWYWGPISGEMAEKLLETEPCGSFIVRDSSDEHYIFSLTFKLNGMVRHVRIEHDQGNFSFGSLQKFRSNTIVDFIENAVEHSRSGRFLFFLHRRPVMGPLRVQLLHPVSRFKRVQSLQHNCRFVILKHVRRDQIDQLPLPDYMKHYLDTPYYYSEELANLQDSMEQEKSRKQLKEMKRNFFLQTSLKHLVSKMLIDQTELEQGLKVKLSIGDESDNHREPRRRSTTTTSPTTTTTVPAPDVTIDDISDIPDPDDQNNNNGPNESIEVEDRSNNDNFEILEAIDDMMDLVDPIEDQPTPPPPAPPAPQQAIDDDVPEYGDAEFDEDEHIVIEL